MSKGRYDETFAGEDDAQSDQSLCWSLEYSMSVKLLTEHRFLEFLNLNQRSLTLCYSWGAAILSTSIKLPLVIKISVLSFLSGRLRQV